MFFALVNAGYVNVKTVFVHDSALGTRHGFDLCFYYMLCVCVLLRTLNTGIGTTVFYQDSAASGITVPSMRQNLLCSGG